MSALSWRVSNLGGVVNNFYANCDTVLSKYVREFIVTLA